jgi:hypothetical protein
MTVVQDVDAYWLDEGTDEAEDFVIAAATDEHGWVQLTINGRVLCLRPSDLTRLIAQGLA